MINMLGFIETSVQANQTTLVTPCLKPTQVTYEIGGIDYSVYTLYSRQWSCHQSSPLINKHFFFDFQVFKHYLGFTKSRQAFW